MSKSTAEFRKAESERPATNQPAVNLPLNRRILDSIGLLVGGLLIVVPPWWLGSVQTTAQCLIYLLTFVGLVAAWVSILVTKNKTTAFPLVAIPVMFGILLAVAQLVPLPATIGNVVSPHHRELYLANAMDTNEQEPDTGTSDARFPATMNPDGTLFHLRLLILALGCVLIGAQFFRIKTLVLWLPIIGTINGVALALFSIAQQMTFNGKIYWFVELSQGGSPFGPYVNRNNASGYLLLCFACSLAFLYRCLATSVAKVGRPRPIIGDDYFWLNRMWLKMILFISELNAKKLAALMATLLIGAAIVSSASRGGAISLVLGSLITFTAFGLIRRPRTEFVPLLVAAMVVFGAVCWFGFGNELARRLSLVDSTGTRFDEDVRVRNWISTAPAIADFGYVGSGLGTYAHVHRLYRQDNEVRYHEVAENQYFQSLVEAGIPGFLLLGLSIFISGWSSLYLLKHGRSSRSVAYGVMGVFALSSIGIASFGDFGLYIPANMVLMALIVGAVCGEAQMLATQIPVPHILRITFGKGLASALMMLIFGAVLFGAVNSYRIARLEKMIDTNPLFETYQTLDAPETEQRIEQLQGWLRYGANHVAERRLGQLWIHRYRLKFYDKLVQARWPDEPNPPVEDLDRLWMQTGLERLHFLLYQALINGSEGRYRSLVGDEVVAENIPTGWNHLRTSRRRAPLQPYVQLLIAETDAAAGAREQEPVDIERAVRLAPSNANTHFVCGILHLQANRLDQGCESLRHALELEPNLYENAVYAGMQRMREREVLDKIIPADNPELLFQFAQNVLLPRKRGELVDIAFSRALEQFSQKTDEDSLKKQIVILDHLGNTQKLIDARQKLKQVASRNRSNRWALAQLFRETGELEKAMDEVKWLINNFGSSQQYDRFYDQVKDEINQANFGD